MYLVQFVSFFFWIEFEIYHCGPLSQINKWLNWKQNGLKMMFCLDFDCEIGIVRILPVIGIFIFDESLAMIDVN